MKMVLILVGIIALALSGCDKGDGTAPISKTPNILFIIMDDVGIDQMQIFGYGGNTPPSTPNIDQVVKEGISFNNTWSMPACSPSRSVIFDGRFPLRNNVLGALGPDDLANSMVSPFEITTPKLLAKRGYVSAMFGKFHLALQGHNPAGYAMPYNLGWDYFAGWLDETGDPSSIDKTAGGVAAPEIFSCGFVPGTSVTRGADSGACYMADGTCQELKSIGPVPPGRTCLEQGGILDPNTTCQMPPPDYLNFTTFNGHFVSPLDFNYPDGSVVQLPPTDSRARQFRTTFAVDEAISWINNRPENQPWMATISFSSDHTPLVQPPVNEAEPGNVTSSNLDCYDTAAQRVLSNLMIQSIDTEVGRLLVETGIAQRGEDGRLIYKPNDSNTMVIIVGDNGSFGPTVKQPFDPTRTKGSVYQTGVWVPLIVAGPLVNEPGRIVLSMVNIADLYALFGEIAGIDDVQKAVPRPIDSMPMLPYLNNPNQSSIRQWNFTQIGVNLQVGGGINGPCTLGNSCSQIPVTKSVCEDNNGTWWGAGHDSEITNSAPAAGFKYCCEVNAFLVRNGYDTYNIMPLTAVAIRNDQYKIVENYFKTYESQQQPCVNTTTTEFYKINENVPVPKLDKEGEELPLDHLTHEQQLNYSALSAQLEAILNSSPPCPGDGNIDFVVNDKDLAEWSFYSESYGLSSVYDLNLDGLTNAADKSIIQQNLGLDCRDN